MATSEKKRSGARFNLFDVILILVIAACIAGIVLHAYFTKDLTETYSETAVVSIRVTGVSEQTAIAFCEPDAIIYLQENDKMIGSIDEAEYAPLILNLENTEGVLVKAEHPEKKEVTATATLTGTWTDDGFLIGGTTLAAVDKTLKIYTEHAVCEIIITGVSK
jgi:hypothetical protein